jgi:hypothetical protein
MVVLAFALNAAIADTVGTTASFSEHYQPYLKNKTQALSPASLASIQPISPFLN